MGLKTWWIQLKTILKEKTEENMRIWLSSLSGFLLSTTWNHSLPSNYNLVKPQSEQNNDESGKEISNSRLTKTRNWLGIKNIRIPKDKTISSDNHFQIFMEKYKKKDDMADVSNNDQDLEDLQFLWLMDRGRLELNSTAPHSGKENSLNFDIFPKLKEISYIKHDIESSEDSCDKFANIKGNMHRAKKKIKKMFHFKK